MRDNEGKMATIMNYMTCKIIRKIGGAKNFTYLSDHKSSIKNLFSATYLYIYTEITYFLD